MMFVKRTSKIPIKKEKMSR